MSNYDLFGGEPPHQRHSDTSKAAAVQIKSRIGPLHQKIIAYLSLCGSAGATDEQMQRCIPMGANTQRPRRIELMHMGKVEDSGRRELTGSRRAAVVWRLVRRGGA